MSGWKHNALVIAATLASTVVFYAAGELILGVTGPPVTFHKSVVHTPDVELGGTFDVTIYRDIHYPCKSALVYKWWKSPGGELQYHGLRPIAGNMKSHIGNPKFTLKRLPLPDNATEGTWCYQPKIQYHCEHGDVTVQQTAACINVGKARTDDG